jgi:hypothetical protein
VLGVAPVFVASLKTGTLTANRSRALALATRDIEAFTAVPYCELGFATTQTGYAASWTDPASSNAAFSTVTVINPPAAEPAPSGPDKTVQGQIYHFERHVVWSSASVGGVAETQAYKRAVSIVTWTDQVGSHTARQDSFVYPGGLGSYAPANCTISDTSAPGQVTAFTATPATGTAGQTQITLAWTNPCSTAMTASPCPTTSTTPAPDGYEIDYTFDGCATSHVLQQSYASSNTTYAAVGLAPATTYGFQVFSLQSATGAKVASSQVSATTLTPTVSGGACTVGQVTVTPQGSDLAPGTSNLSQNPVVVAHTSGSCPFLTVAYEPTQGSGIDEHTTMTQNPTGVWTATLAGTTDNWSVGAHPLQVQDDAGNVLLQSTVTACVQGKPTCP